MQLRSRWLRARLGLETLTGLRRSGYFIPYGRAASAEPFEGHDYPHIRSLFENRRGTFSELLDAIDSHACDLLAISGLEPPQPRFEQDWFARLDAAAHYAMVRKFKPRRIVEVGSGHSTRWICRALADGGIDCQVTAIDPRPRADISLLPVRIVRSTLQEADLTVFDGIAPGDFVCMDSSHVFMPGTDVEVMLNHILPRLPAGVFVFFHDIFLPEPYPASWYRLGYSEQNAVAILLQGAFEPVFSSAFAASSMADAVNRTVLARIALHPGAIENGLWLRKTTRRGDSPS